MSVVELRELCECSNAERCEVAGLGELCEVAEL